MTRGTQSVAYEGYHQFETNEDGCRHHHGSFEVFHHDGTWIDQEDDSPEGYHMLAKGWYWWACFPGCLPDGEPSGPFETAQQAYNDAQEE